MVSGGLLPVPSLSLFLKILHITTKKLQPRINNRDVLGDLQMDLTSWKTQAKRLKKEIQALYLATRDPRTPWYAKVLAVLIIGYALSPIDLIPDFIPVLGYLDDLIIVPAGIALLIKIIPNGVLQECREKASSQPMSIRRNWVAGTIIILIWLLLIYIALSLLWGIIKG